MIQQHNHSKIMKIFQFAVVLASIVQFGGAVELASNVTGSSYSFGGSNSYFIHGTSDEEKREWVDTLAGWGAKVVRLWGMMYFPWFKR